MKLLSALLYYVVILPVSLLPFPLLYALSSLLYVFIYHVFGYRRKVVMENLRNSFPGKPEEERKRICKKFYKHLCDVLLDGFKAFTVSEKQLRKHLRCNNPELLNRFYDEGKSVIIAVGHYGSWELFLAGINLFIRHKAVVIYQPLTNEYFNKKILEARSDLGTIMLPAKEVKAFFAQPSGEKYATVFAIDQSPSNPESCYWMNFLHQDTGVLFGTEKYAKSFNQPVLYARLIRERRGYYGLEFELVTETPQETAHGEITEKVTRLLERDIIAKPEFWLWSHKRWKHKRKPA